MKRQRGSILIVVILISALLSMLAVEIYARLAIDSRRTLNLLDSDRAYYYALGAEELALQILSQSLSKKDGESAPDTVNLGQTWAKKGMVFPIEGGQLAGNINDMSACFNINSILDEGSKKSNVNGSSNNIKPLKLSNNKPLDGQKLLEVLFTQLVPNAEITPKAMAARIRDWIDEDTTPFGSDGAEDDTYMGLDHPYRTGNTLMGSVEELRTLYEFSPQIVEKISPYLCALPETRMKTININTISKDHPELLMMLYDGLDLDKAKEILSKRPKSGYDKTTFDAQIGKSIKLRKEAKDRVSFSSDRFQINAIAVVGRGESRLQSLVRKGKKGHFAVISRKFMSDFDIHQMDNEKSTNNELETK